MLFMDYDKEELKKMGWSSAQIGAIEKHTKELYENHRDDYARLDNYRYARVGVRDEEIGFNVATNLKDPKVPFAYDRTLNCSDGKSKIMYGFNYQVSSKKPLPKHPYRD